MIVRTEEDLNGLKEIGKIVAAIRDEMVQKAKPGVTTLELDNLAGELFEQYGAISAPKNEVDFPGFTCICVNEEVAHGIPGKRKLKEGDLVNIDVSASKNGYFADTGISIVIGQGEPIVHELLEAAQEVFDAGLKKFKVGSKMNGVGKAVYNTARQKGFTVIKNLTGHGVGTALHEAPDHILNYYDPQDNALFKDGMVIAYEPFVSTKAEEVFTAEDGWTFTTEDKSYVVQIEHTLIVTKKGPVIITE
ncbi:MAG: type I methionyl aminopeptidase [Bacillus sp. (in: firmicutes)]